MCAVCANVAMVTVPSGPEGCGLPCGYEDCDGAAHWDRVL